MNKDNALWSISAVDGRYAARTQKLQEFFSEAALIRYRLVVEARWLVFLAEHVPSCGLRLDKQAQTFLAKLSDPSSYSAEDLQRVKDIEQTTNHDVKACEYFLRECLAENGWDEAKLALIHFSCTSEDINNTAYGLMIRDYRERILVPELRKIEEALAALALQLKDQPMLARTHGQTASPTTLGKEMGVFLYRLAKVRKNIEKEAILAKFNGAVGHFNAHYFSLPQENWVELGQKFVEESLGLAWNPMTTQIENHDWISTLLDDVRRHNSIAIGLCRDIWSYISLGYFRQKVIAGEVGSSTMPHKVNPIDFENAEGNFGIANGLAAHLSEKLVISRMQRDLSDSTVLRSLGTLFGHHAIAIQALLKGLGKVVPCVERLEEDLEQAWEVLAEPVQSVLRLHGVMNAYEQLKEATRGQPITKEGYQKLVMNLTVLPAAERERLLKLTPREYTGLASQMVHCFIQDWQNDH